MNKSILQKNPNIFKGINRNDIQRVQRAISVYKGTGLTLKDGKKENKKEFKNLKDLQKFFFHLQKRNRKKIKKRFDQMLKKGAQ